MPSPRNPKRPTASTALLDTLTDSAALPALVARLEPGELKHLVDTVGLEDAGALVAHASTSQLAHLLNESVWTSTNPGDPATLSVPELLRWFDLWLDMGAGFIAEKLFELGEGFCALALAKLVTVKAVDLAPGEVDEFSQVIGEYFIRSDFDDEWDTVQAALVALWDDYPDFLEALFARLSFRHSVLGIFGENDTPLVMEADASHERESRKEAEGFVGSTTAGAFLQSIAAAELDALVNEQAYDVETAEYFRRRQREAPRASEGPPPAASEGADEEKSDQIDVELDELQRELEQYEVLHDEQVALLTGPEASARAVELPIRRALAAVVEQPDCFAARSNELAYLSNLVLAGVASEPRLSESEAANLVMSTCNLGGSYALWAEVAEEDDDESPYVEMLLAEPGLVRLFRIGWNLLSHLPVQAASRLSRTLSSPQAAERLSSKQWLVDEVHALLNNPDLLETVRSGDFEQAQETVKVLSIAMEPATVHALCLLIDHVPRLAEPAPSDLASPRSRYIASMEDLLALERFFGQLAEKVGV